jgi:zinc protease
VLDYFVEQPGRYTLTESFFANHHALIHRLNDPSTPPGDRRGLAFDREVVAFYGDPKWSARMAEMPKYYDQTLEIQAGTYTVTITPNRGEASFQPVNTNGSQRGWRPMIQFLPHRVTDVELVAGEDLDPVITDDFVLVPNPRQCEPDREYVVRFEATRLTP